MGSIISHPINVPVTRYDVLKLKIVSRNKLLKKFITVRYKTIQYRVVDNT